MDIITVALLVLVFVVLSSVFGDDSLPSDHRTRTW
jgi:hypothetical protein